ncbi:MAG TPA: hypothetical protein DCW29_04135 [Janthinobacterium sp.]|nr:hypothetical protein [Janthinobacterium sp.]
MKKAIVFFCIAIGVGIALFTTFFEDTGVKIVMSCIGAMVGTIVGGALAGICDPVHGSVRSTVPDDEDMFVGLGLTPADLMQNYWRDKGRPPLTEDFEPEQGDHTYDGSHFPHDL